MSEPITTNPSPTPSASPRVIKTYDEIYNIIFEWRDPLDTPKGEFILSASTFGNIMNHIDDTYLEISRRPDIAAPSLGGQIILGFLMFFTAMGCFWTIISIGQSGHAAASIASVFLFLFFIFMLIIAYWALSLSYQHYFSMPRDWPIRFNRSTGRIYIYEYTQSIWGRSQTHFYSYDWEHVRAYKQRIERDAQQAAQSRYSRLYGLFLVIIDPKTQQGLRGFKLSDYPMLWDFICHYMQEGVPRDGVDSIAGDPNNPRRRNIPKTNKLVIWPPDIDAVSRLGDASAPMKSELLQPNHATKNYTNDDLKQLKKTIQHYKQLYFLGVCMACLILTFISRSIFY